MDMLAREDGMGGSSLAVMTPEELVGRPRDGALDVARDLFQRFGWDASLSLLRGIQDEMGRGVG
jgi:hypothetical protein